MWWFLSSLLLIWFVDVLYAHFTQRTERSLFKLDNLIMIEKYKDFWILSFYSSEGFFCTKGKEDLWTFQGSLDAEKPVTSNANLVLGELYRELIQKEKDGTIQFGSRGKCSFLTGSGVPVHD